MSHKLPPEVTAFVAAEDLDNGINLVTLIGFVARRVGRPIDWTTVDTTRAKEIAEELLIALRLMESPPPAIPDGVEGVQIGTRHA